MTYSVTGAVAWYDASQETVPDGTLVGTLTDRSGAGNHATQTATARATLKTAAMGGNAVYRFAGAQEYPLPNVFSALTAAEVFVAVKVDADPPGGFLVSGLWHLATAVDSTHYPFTDGVIYDAFGSTVRKTVGNPASSLAAARIYNVASGPGSWTARLDGTQVFTTATNTVGLTTTPILGKSRDGYWLDGDLGEFLIFNKVLTASERADVLAGMRAKWQPPPAARVTQVAVEVIVRTRRGWTIGRVPLG